MEKLNEFKLQNAMLNKVMGGTHYICTGNWSYEGQTTYDCVLTGSDGSWIGEPICDCPDNGVMPNLGEEVDICAMRRTNNSYNHSTLTSSTAAK